MAGEDDIIGVYQLIARDIFASQAAKRKEIELTVHVSYFEIYGGMVYDLLSNRERLRVLENGKGQVVVRGLAELQVRTRSLLLPLTFRGEFFSSFDFLLPHLH